MNDRQKNMANRRNSKTAVPQIAATLDSKVNEVLHISTYFVIMNETKWNVHDDDFYLVKRSWFEIWKRFIAYDYILLKHVSE
jgi:hypothetical protein